MHMDAIHAALINMGVWTDGFYNAVIASTGKMWNKSKEPTGEGIGAVNTSSSSYYSKRGKRHHDEYEEKRNKQETGIVKDMVHHAMYTTGTETEYQEDHDIARRIDSHYGEAGCVTPAETPSAPSMAVSYEAPLPSLRESAIRELCEKYMDVPHHLLTTRPK